MHNMVQLQQRCNELYDSLAASERENPLLHFYLENQKDSLRSWTARDIAVTKCSWAVPNDEAIATIVEYSPLVEIGAGLGYWAAILARQGADIVCYDTNAGNYGHHKEQPFYPVLFGDENKIAEHIDRVLFLCWPCYATDFASNCLSLYKGTHLIYIGEGYGGCTGDDEFHEMLASDWNKIKTVSIPQWSGIHDYLGVYERKSPKLLVSVADRLESSV